MSSVPAARGRGELSRGSPLGAQSGARRAVHSPSLPETAARRPCCPTVVRRSGSGARGFSFAAGAVSTRALEPGDGRTHAHTAVSTVHLYRHPIVAKTETDLRANLRYRELVRPPPVAAERPTTSAARSVIHRVLPSHDQRFSNEARHPSSSAVADQRFSSSSDGDVIGSN